MSKSDKTPVRIPVSWFNAKSDNIPDPQREYDSRGWAIRSSVASVFDRGDGVMCNGFRMTLPSNFEGVLPAKLGSNRFPEGDVVVPAGSLHEKGSHDYECVVDADAKFTVKPRELPAREYSGAELSAMALVNSCAGETKNAIYGVGGEAQAIYDLAMRTPGGAGPWEDFMNTTKLVPCRDLVEYNGKFVMTPGAYKASVAAADAEIHAKMEEALEHDRDWDHEHAPSGDEITCGRFMKALKEYNQSGAGAGVLIADLRETSELWKTSEFHEFLAARKAARPVYTPPDPLVTRPAKELYGEYKVNKALAREKLDMPRELHSFFRKDMMTHDGEPYTSEVSGQQVYGVKFLPRHYITSFVGNFDRVYYMEYDSSTWPTVEIPVENVMMNPADFPSVDGEPVDTTKLAETFGGEFGMFKVNVYDNYDVVDTDATIPSPHYGMLHMIDGRELSQQATLSLEMDLHKSMYNHYPDESDGIGSMESNIYYSDIAHDDPYRRIVRLSRGMWPYYDYTTRNTGEYFSAAWKNLDVSGLPFESGYANLYNTLIPKDYLSPTSAPVGGENKSTYGVLVPDVAGLSADGIQEKFRASLVHFSADQFCEASEIPGLADNPDAKNYLMLTMPFRHTIAYNYGVTDKGELTNPVLSAAFTCLNAARKNPDMSADDLREVYERVITSPGGGAAWTRFELESGYSMLDLVKSDKGFVLSDAAKSDPKAIAAFENFNKTGASCSVDAAGQAEIQKAVMNENEASKQYRRDVAANRLMEAVEKVASSGRDMSDVNRAVEGLSSGGDDSLQLQ